MAGCVVILSEGLVAIKVGESRDDCGELRHGAPFCCGCFVLTDIIAPLITFVIFLIGLIIAVDTLPIMTSIPANADVSSQRATVSSHNTVSST